MDGGVGCYGSNRNLMQVFKVECVFLCFILFEKSRESLTFLFNMIWQETIHPPNVSIL